jgi:AcrR family transcriptional regulator
MMAKKDPNSRTDKTRARILAAASELFTRKGYAAATTRAIAQAAGVNEVTLFRHFGSKENLAKAIMDQFGGPAIAADLESRFSGDYLQDLSLFGHAMLKVMTERSDVMRMAICEAGIFPEFQQVVAENPRQLRRALARYLEKQMKAGIISNGHPEVLAQAFLGMFFSYVVLEGFLLDKLQPQVTSVEIVDQFVRLFARGTMIVQE